MTLISTDVDIPLDVIKTKDGLFLDSSHEWEMPYDFGPYKINSKGLRTGDLNKKYDLVVSGCSLTYGIGIPEEGRWGDLLGNMLGIDVANLSYSGRCTETMVNNTIKYILKNKPKILICFFPNFERFTFVSNKSINAVNLGSEKMSLAPTDNIQNCFPVGLAWQTALDSISMLEDICKILSINFMWSTWSISNLNQSYKFSNFNSYVEDTSMSDFPPYLQWNSWTEDKNKRKNLFISRDMKCHMDHPLSNSKYYDYGGDSAMRIDKDLGKGFCPHPGIHRNIHWAEFFYDRIKEYDNSWN